MKASSDEQMMVVTMMKRMVEWAVDGMVADAGESVVDSAGLVPGVGRNQDDTVANETNAKEAEEAEQQSLPLAGTALKVVLHGSATGS
jgi:hypothetical protein